MRFFNTAGTVDCDDHYCLPPLKRFDLPEIISLVEQKKYFILHAPRQTGKTSCLLALMRHLNDGDRFSSVYVNVESARAACEDVAAAMRDIVFNLAESARIYLDDGFLLEHFQEILTQSGPFGALRTALGRWADHSTTPLVVLLDEIDSLIGDTLISVLRQIRAGYTARPVQFPQSIGLCGVRDLRDYRTYRRTTYSMRPIWG